MCCVAVAAGSAFCQAARLHMQMQNKLDSATSFVDAGNAYKKADPQGERVSLIAATTKSNSNVINFHVIIRVIINDQNKTFFFLEIK